MGYDFAPARWNLRELMPAPEDSIVDGCPPLLEAAVAEVEAARPSLGPDLSTARFSDTLKHYETINRLSSRLGAYAFLRFAEGTQDAAAADLRGRTEQRLAEINNRVLFFSLWFKDLPDAAATRLMAASEGRRYFLESLRRFRPHTLPEAEEQIINLKDVNGIEALVKIYDMITSKFAFTLDVDGQAQTLTRDGLAAYYRHPSPDQRAAAYRELFRVYAENAPLLAQIYAHRVRDWRAEGMDLRHYAAPIAARNLANDLPDAAVEALLSVCRQNAGLFQRYFKLKAGWLGLDRLRRCDIYAPLSESEKRYDYAAAVELALGSLRDFSPALAGHAERVFHEEHIDSELRPGKRGGAFCYAVLPELTPWVLVNYAGRARDVATLAHEIGHAVHGMMSAAQSPLTYHPATPLAETASVFSEMLLTDRLLREERDATARRDILARALDDAYATVLRQAYFTLFERDAHDMIAAGRSMDDLCAHYMANLTEQFGDAVALSDEFRWEWISIPHFYATPFYTYSYSFGQLLVLALYRRFKQEGAGFIPNYHKLLAYGGSAAPAAILAEAGIDVASPAFWQGGFDVIAGLIEELESIE